MLSRVSPLLRSSPPSMAARVLSLTCPTVIHLPSTIPHQPPRPGWKVSMSCSESVSVVGSRGFASNDNSYIARRFRSRNGSFALAAAAKREYRKFRGRRAAKKSKDKELELSVRICLEEQLPEDPEIMDIAEMMRLNAPMAMKLAFERLSDSEYKTRDASIHDVGCFKTVELSVLLCNDEFIRKLNKEWRDEDHATDVLSMSQHIPELKLPILMMGDIVISVETAARQAEERGHTLIDEIRILMVHGLLHLLGFDHELSDEAEEEMENEEEYLLNGLGWKGKGLIQSACDAGANGSTHLVYSDDRKRVGSLRFYKPKYGYIFCDMDGTLLNSRSQISVSTAEALKEASSRGVKIVIATGKSRPAVIRILKTVNLAGSDGIVSEFSPGIFVQGLLVYGRHGQEIFRRNLNSNVCIEALQYSIEHKIPIIAFSEDRCLTLFEHPLVDLLHTVYHEPKAEIIPSVKQLLATGNVQKLLFLDTTEGVSGTLRPYWEEAVGDRASVVQAVSDMLEIVPPGTSKGNGVRVLLDHLGISAKEVMAIGDGENDVEMLELASLGIALSNGSEKAKAVANVIGVSNDEDGVADAIYRYAF
ncbi:endoribonuclease YBEY, chloroplastic [Andrographis paniculata]|uniref:endoribonuclease YBEY, chloroplastic n=1 Tax=Andrographis paniculata TaxID=175694 RepID=UPI0021E87C49|nr:endoribonuclease YBEY, chloroplastic [Andrographis paniculata]